MKRYRHPLVLWLVIAIQVSPFTAFFAAESPFDCHAPAISQGLDLIEPTLPEVILRAGQFDWRQNLTSSPLNLKNDVQPISGSSLKNHPKNTASCSYDGGDDFPFFPSRFIQNRSLRL